MVSLTSVSESSTFVSESSDFVVESDECIPPASDFASDPSVSVIQSGASGTKTKDFMTQTDDFLS